MELKKSYFKEQFDTKINTVKQLWNNLASVASLGRKKNKNKVFKLKEDDKYLTDRAVLSDKFNNYFCSVGSNLQRQIKNCNNVSFKSFLPQPTRDSMFCSPVTDTEIFQIINRLNNKKSPGPDNIGPRLLKEIATEIVGPLVILFNLSLLTGLVPDSLKIARVIPLFKKGDSCLVENYPPISLLNIFDKILDKIMCTRLYCYLSDHHILYDYQFWFRKCHSTTLALIDVLDQI